MSIGTSRGSESPILANASATRGYFIVRYVAARIVQALGISLNPVQDWEQCQDLLYPLCNWIPCRSLERIRLPSIALEIEC
jgi:hypothetical protein